RERAGQAAPVGLVAGGAVVEVGLLARRSIRGSGALAEGLVGTAGEQEGNAEGERQAFHQRTPDSNAGKLRANVFNRDSCPGSRPPPLIRIKSARPGSTNVPHRRRLRGECGSFRTWRPGVRVSGPIHLLQLPLIVALATGAEPPVPDGDGVATLDAVVVVSSRVPEPLSQVVASVAQVEREELDRHLVRDPEGLVRYMPGVEVVSEGNRFGTRGFSIRGLEGNRVRIVVDGVPLADAYSIGQFASAGRDLVDLEAV